MPRRRPIRPEEEALWHAVARTAKPMHAPVFRKKLHDLPAAVAEPAVKIPTTPRLAPFRLGEKPSAPRPQIAPSSALNMDAKSFGKMTRGKLSPEARIDLHGMTLAEAHPELTRFIHKAHVAGLRLVLVITGKGKPGVDTGPMPRRTGILRQQVPHWLHQPPLGALILQVTEAHLRHGGGGAYYVYLRRSR